MKIIPLVFAGLALVSLPSLAQDKACSKGDAAKAEKVIDNVTSFAQLNKSWQDWRHCDSGPVAETYSEALFRLLVDWKGVETLATGMQSSPQYKEWVHARVRAGSAEDRKAIFSRAKTGCPSKLGDFCGELTDAASGEKKAEAPAPAPPTSAPALLPAPTPPK